MKLINQIGILSSLIIFSAHSVPIGKWILKKVCVSETDRAYQNNKAHQPCTLEQLIQKNKERIKAQLFHPDIDTIEPLPFAVCTKPALFDLAANSTHYELVQVALQNPTFDINKLIDCSTHNTIFHRCAFAGSYRILKLLLDFCTEKNIDHLTLLNRKNNVGFSAVAAATYAGRSRCLSLLLSAGANPDSCTVPLIHLATSSICRGQTKRNHIIHKLLNHSPHLLWQTHPNGSSAEASAQENGFDGTAEQIRVYKKAYLWHLYNDTQLRFNRLPREIFSQVIDHCIDS